MKRVLSLTVLLTALFAAQSSHAQSTTAADRLISTWTLVSVERNISSGEPTRTQAPRGVLILDGAGNVFEYFSAIDIDQDERMSEAMQTLESVGGFWGRYSVDEDAGRIHFESNGGISPSVHGLEFSRSFELSGDRLTLTSTNEPQAQGDARWTWNRIPTIENLSPVYRQVVGFWQHVQEHRIDLTTREISNVRMRAPSLIVYTPGGFAGVHFPTVGREPFADPFNPTDEEAQAAVRGYLGYFGTLNVYPGEVAHNVLSGISPTTGSILRRFADITGDELVVTLSGGNNAQSATQVILTRLSDAEDMLPR